MLRFHHYRSVLSFDNQLLRHTAGISGSDVNIRNPARIHRSLVGKAAVRLADINRTRICFIPLYNIGIENRTVKLIHLIGPPVPGFVFFKIRIPGGGDKSGKFLLSHHGAGGTDIRFIHAFVNRISLRIGHSRHIYGLRLKIREIFRNGIQPDSRIRPITAGGGIIIGIRQLLTVINQLALRLLYRFGRFHIFRNIVIHLESCAVIHMGAVSGQPRMQHLRVGIGPCAYRLCFQRFQRI